MLSFRKTFVHPHSEIFHYGDDYGGDDAIHAIHNGDDDATFHDGAHVRDSGDGGDPL